MIPTDHHSRLPKIVPVAKRPNLKRDYKTPHWVPVVFDVRKDTEGDADAQAS